ncbi:hypothetical protein V5O48_017407 [Marasmius crinis-equi]|uniref:Uncharacterized protein n=1 Tax=Marasmius crinis-equi TaxID=585013 RepID=A0ABR3EP42_9AGAR
MNRLLQPQSLSRGLAASGLRNQAWMKHSRRSIVYTSKPDSSRSASAPRYPSYSHPHPRPPSSNAAKPIPKPPKLPQTRMPTKPPNAASKPTPTEPTPAEEPAPVRILKLSKNKKMNDPFVPKIMNHPKHQFAVEYIAKHGHGEEGERKVSRHEIKQAWFALGHKGRVPYEKKARAVKHEMTQEKLKLAKSKRQSSLDVQNARRDAEKKEKEREKVEAQAET